MEREKAMQKAKDSLQEIQRLRREMCDLVALSTLPGVWAPNEPAQIAVSLAETLQSMLSLDLIYLRIRDQYGQERISLARGDGSCIQSGQEDQIADALGPWLEADSVDATPKIPHPIGKGIVRLAVVPLECNPEVGGVVAASKYPGFPTSTDELLLRIGVNQASVLLHQKWAEEALREADRRKDEFLAMLAHELRNPLTPIAGAVDLLRRGQDDSSIHQIAVSALDNQVGTLTRLVDDLLDVSRVTTGRVQLQRKNVELNSLVQSVADSFRPQMLERQHEFTVSLHQTPLSVHGDPIRLEQVVVNLLSNAAKYTPEGGLIQLTVTERGSEALIRVKDSGIGVEAQLLPHLFELFSQGNKTLDRTQSGLGIGLSLVKSLVEMHGGMVSATSEGTGRGSEFTVQLPTVEGSAPQPEPISEEPTRQAAEPLRVLLVDDNADTRDIFGTLVEKLGNQVRTAHDGPSALEAAGEFRPEVVLLDIGLPGLDGYEVARRMRQEPLLQNAVLIAVTGYGEQSDLQRSEQAGFNYHLVKPLGIDTLREVFTAIAENWGIIE